MHKDQVIQESYNYSVPHSYKKMAKNPEKGFFK